MNIDESQIYALAPFAATLGVRFPMLGPERVQAVLPARHQLSTLGGGLHGGAIMSVCDVASAVCVALNVDEGCAWTTAESTTYFLRPVRSTATATSTPLKIGRTLATIKTEVHDDDDLLCAYTTQMVYITRPTG